MKRTQPFEQFCDMKLPLFLVSNWAYDACAKPAKAQPKSPSRVGKAKTTAGLGSWLVVLLGCLVAGVGSVGRLPAQCLSCNSTQVKIQANADILSLYGTGEGTLHGSFDGATPTFTWKLSPDEPEIFKYWGEWGYWNGGTFDFTLNSHCSIEWDVIPDVNDSNFNHLDLTLPGNVDVLIDGSVISPFWHVPNSCNVIYSFYIANDNLLLYSGDIVLSPGPHDFSVRSRAVVPATEANTSLGSVHAQFGLGVLPAGDAAGSIDLDQTTLSASSYDPASLIYSARPGVKTVPATLSLGTPVRQINAPQCFADIVPLADAPSSGYEIRFYAPSQVGTIDSITGLYVLSGSPSATWRVQNPDASSTITNRLDITEIRGGRTTLNEYAYNAPTDTWSVSRGGGASIETKASTSLANGDTLVIQEVQGTSGKASHVEHTYHQFAWGQEETETVVGEGTAQQGTLYTFGNGLQTSVLNPDGSYAVNNDTNDPDATTGTFMDAPTFADTQNQPGTGVGWYRSGDGSYEKINGQYVRQSIQSTTPSDPGNVVYPPTSNCIDVQITQDASDGVADAYGNCLHVLTTTIGTYSSSCASPWTSQPAYTQYPDGRQDTWLYEPGDFLTASDGAFHYDPNGAAVRRTLTHGTAASPGGMAGLSTQERSTYDEQGHLALEEVLVMPQGATGFVVTSATTHTYDAVGNLTGSIQNGRTIYSAIWQNGYKISETDEQGVVTTYSNFDGLGRALTVTKTGAPASGQYPAQADVPTALVIDANGQTLSQTAGATGGQQLVQTSAYNTAGQLVSQTSSGITTNYTYANGGRTVTQQIGTSGPTTITDHYLDGRVKSVGGTGVMAKAYVYGVVTADDSSTGDKAGYQWTTEYIGTSNPASPTARYTKTVTDWLGRTTRVENPAFGGGTTNTCYYYNAAGQLAKVTQPGMADTLYTYDVMGNQNASGLDMDGNGTLDGGGSSTDRFTTTDVSYQQVNGNVCRVTTNTVHGDSPVTTTQTEQLTGLPTNTVSIVTTSGPRGASTFTTVVDATNKLMTTTAAVPGVTNISTQVTYNGLLVAATSPVSTVAAIFGYDGLGRQITSTDPSIGATTMTAYDPVSGQPASITTVSANGSLSSSTADTYFGPTTANPGQLQKSIVNGMETDYTYDPQGQVVSVSGNTYPLVYAYDGYGALQTLTTTGAAGNAVTTWVYDAATGLLKQKLDDSHHGPSYTYWPSGRVKTRTWARGITTSYYYDKGGAVIDTKYSDGTTPEVVTTNNRLGNPTTVVDAAGTHTLTYTADGQLAGDSIGGSGPLAGTAVSMGYDGLLRRQSLSATGGSGLSYSVGYAYDPATGNLAGVTDNSNGTTVNYAYQPNSTRLASTTFSHGGAVRLTTTRTPDGLGRLASITNTAGGSTGVVSSHAYTYNAQGQRGTATLADASVWTYGYNSNGELTGGHRAWTSGGTAVAGQQFGYAYDGIGNRTGTTTNGRSATYTVNALNQYTTRQVPGAVDVLGTVDPSATVTINNLPADSRQQGGYFYKALSVNNAGGPVNQAVDVLAVKNGAGAGGADVVSETKGSVFVPQTPETFSYDLDGNLTQDGRWTYSWNGENRLVSMTSRSASVTYSSRTLTFAYDWQGRRVSKTVTTQGFTPINLSTSTQYLYDGWSLVGELGLGNVALRTYVWGTDLSGSLQGAGGVGGLLALNDYTGGGGGQTYYAGCDGNGNVMALTSAADGSLGARYEYSPAGETLRASGGSIAAANPIRWSSKYVDVEDELVYYGYRCYGAGKGRWHDKDPVK